MKKIILISLLILKTNLAFSEIEIRFAKIQELNEILAFDRDTSFEYFKPLYEKHYSNFDIGKNVDYYLDIEIKNDAIIFPDYINSIKNKRMLIAFDNKENCIAGLHCRTTYVPQRS